MKIKNLLSNKKFWVTVLTLNIILSAYNCIIHGDNSFIRVLNVFTIALSSFTVGLWVMD